MFTIQAANSLNFLAFLLLDNKALDTLRKKKKTKPLLVLSLLALCCAVASVVSDSLQPMDYSPPGASVHSILQARILECISVPSSRGSSQTGIEPIFLESAALQADSLLTEPPGKPLTFINESLKMKKRQKGIFLN